MNSPVENKRTQKRVEASLPVQIRGLDTQGEAYEEFTAAVDVSRRGLSLLTARDLPVFSNVTVVIPGRGPAHPGQGPSDFFAEAVVVSVRRENDMNRVGLRFVGATLQIYTSETG
jgi:hypothetical protein